MSKSFVILISTIVVVILVIGESLAANEPLIPKGCDCLYTQEFDPVCGNNGVTYPNLAILKCADKCAKYNIHQMHHGPCKA
ncbi:PREDICTED: elastase inhibitor-like [Ceratosolen solmsi marchali]|uniref:Elastase inhibitor-like n=1 Tax=Ceratosolen solmsi marchali TaxID=326594 RepID=A0AAJ6YG37_9HYME|nr:PREDICTED: elastase inhibitor-like [Ceratosolen solmsi marchali]